MSTENDASTGELQEESRPVFYPAAMILTWGLVLLIGGQFVYAIAQANALMDVVAEGAFASSDTKPAMVAGAIAALTGLVMVINGVWRLAGHVDRLARHLYRP